MSEDVKRLVAAGGKLWEKGGKSRLYFNNLDALYGLKVTRRKSGTISSATLDGEEISNGEATRLLGVLNETKIWYDLTDHKFYFRVPGSSRYDMDAMANGLIQKIKEVSASFSEEAAEDLPDLKRPPTLLDKTSLWCEEYGVTLPPELVLLTEEELRTMPDFFRVRNKRDPVVHIHLTVEPDEPGDPSTEYFVYSIEAGGQTAHCYVLTEGRLLMGKEINYFSMQRENVWRLGRPGMVTGRYDRDLEWEPRPVRKLLEERAGVKEPEGPIGAHGITYKPQPPRDIYGAPMMRTSTGKLVSADEWDDYEADA